MRANIIYGSTKENRSSHIIQIVPKNSELTHIYPEKTSITIKQIQDLIAPLSISPRIERIVWIEEANTLSIPAQNSLLKLLEEPPKKTTFYLSCQSHTSLLPTIISRSSIQFVKSSTKDIAPNSPLLSEIKKFFTLSFGDRLTNYPKMDKSETLIWIQKIEEEIKQKLNHSNLTNQNYQMLSKISNLLLTLHTQILANCNTTLSMQIFLLKLPKTN